MRDYTCIECGARFDSDKPICPDCGTNKVRNTLRQIAWNVYRRGRLIDTVFFTEDCDLEYVQECNRNHYGADVSTHKAQNQMIPHR